jgi:protein-tyrosine kinase
MEKIKEALAKAKSQKPAAAEAARTVGSQKNISSTESELSAIHYNTSAVIKLNSAHLEKNRIVSTLSGDVNAGVFDSLRTQVLQKMEENNWRTLAVVSPTPESGKTLVSINLAISIAHQPQKTVILVDFDLRRPKVANSLGLHANKSLNEYLRGEARADEVMINPGIPRLLIMPTMRPVSRSSETLSSSKVGGLIKELRDRYDSRIVIFDLPPVLSSDDAMVMIPHVDCVLMVVASGMSTEAEIEETLHHLPKENLLGVVFNKAEIEPKAYYY